MRQQASIQKILNFFFASATPPLRNSCVRCCRVTGKICLCLYVFVSCHDTNEFKHHQGRLHVEVHHIAQCISSQSFFPNRIPQTKWILPGLPLDTVAVNEVSFIFTSPDNSPFCHLWCQCVKTRIFTSSDDFLNRPVGSRWLRCDRVALCSLYFTTKRITSCLHTCKWPPPSLRA